MAIRKLDGDRVAVCPRAMQSLISRIDEAKVTPNERPILMNGEMVRSTLAGRKTQTRRIAIVSSDPNRIIPTDFDAIEALLEIENTFNGRRTWMPCPFGKPGDRLYVRETWSTHACFDKIAPRELTTRSVHYWADGKIETGKGRPSIHMPRWASRIHLKISDVRVERLQDISEKDVLAEGVVAEERHMNGYCAGEFLPPYLRAWRELWESINGAGSWDLNPYVWAITFKRLPQ